MTDFIPGNIKRRHFEAHSFALDGSLNKPLKLQKGKNNHKNGQYRLSAVFQAMCYQHYCLNFSRYFSQYKIITQKLIHVWNHMRVSK